MNIEYEELKRKIEQIVPVRLLDKIYNLRHYNSVRYCDGQRILSVSFTVPVSEEDAYFCTMRYGNG